jgi:antitoxin HicB
MRNEQSYAVILEPQPEGGFTVRVPALPEVVTEGESVGEALTMARDAIELVLAHRRELEDGARRHALRRREAPTGAEDWRRGDGERLG